MHALDNYRLACIRAMSSSGIMKQAHSSRPSKSPRSQCGLSLSSRERTGSSAAQMISISGCTTTIHKSVLLHSRRTQTISGELGSGCFLVASTGTDDLDCLLTRCLAVHPTQPLVITGSDDMTIKLWDWEKGWKCMQVCRLYGVLASASLSDWPMHTCRHSKDTPTTS